MKELKHQFEKGVAERFFEWLSNKGGPTFSFSRRAGEAPDLVYVCGTEELYVEITSAYYDKDHAKFLWKYARGDEEAPLRWHGTGDPHEALAAAIVERTEEKCLKRYGNRTLLLLEVPPGLTVAENLQEPLKKKTFPTIIPFMGVYVVGRFPEGEFSVGGHRVFSPTGYRVLPIKESTLTSNLLPSHPD